MPSNISIYTAIYDETGIFKHWSLFLDGTTDVDKTELQVMGSDGRFWFEEKNANPRDAQDLLELVYLCELDADQLGSIKDIAKRVPVRNEIAGWNCQDFVLDLLDALEDDGVIDAGNEAYVKRKENLRGRQDGLE